MERRRELMRNEVFAIVIIKTCLIAASARFRPVYKRCSAQTP
jgi:hypothetical protein